MNDKNNKEIFEERESVFCIDQSTYDMHITKRKKYKISQVGVGTKSGKLEITGDSNRLVWISELHFSKTNQPSVTNITIDDKIDFVQEDCVEITVTFEDNKKGWLRTITPKYLMNRVLKDNKFYVDRNAIFVSEISKERIVQTIEKLDKSNQLLELLIFD